MCGLCGGGRKRELSRELGTMRHGMDWKKTLTMWRGQHVRAAIQKVWEQKPEPAENCQQPLTECRESILGQRLVVLLYMGLHGTTDYRGRRDESAPFSSLRYFA
jgi:hypothetical protein